MASAVRLREVDLQKSQRLRVKLIRSLVPHARKDTFLSRGTMAAVPGSRATATAADPDPVAVAAVASASVAVAVPVPVSVATAVAATPIPAATVAALAVTITIAIFARSVTGHGCVVDGSA